MQLSHQYDSKRYEVLEKIGEGAFGEVYKVRDQLTGQIRALKKIQLNRYHITSPKRKNKSNQSSSEEELPITAFREMKSLQELNHPNVMKLIDVIPKGSDLGLILEYVPLDLARLLSESKQQLSQVQVKTIMRMLLRGIAHCHEYSIVHRDIKPANLLINNEGVLKIGDFGLATVHTGCNKSYSHQVATRWYRSPELLFGSRSYDSSIDIWSIGVIFAELLLNVPLFTGENDIDQIYCVMQILGTPSNEWPSIRDLPDYKKITFPECVSIPLSTIIPDASAEAINLLYNFLNYDPSKRCTATEALMHPYFFTQPLPGPKLILTENGY